MQRFFDSHMKLVSNVASCLFPCGRLVTCPGTLNGHFSDYRNQVLYSDGTECLIVLFFIFKSIKPINRIVNIYRLIYNNTPNNLLITYF